MIKKVRLRTTRSLLLISPRPGFLVTCLIHNPYRFDAGTRNTMTIERTRGLLVAAATGMLTLGIAGPAVAAATSATVTVTGGALSITAPASAGNLGTMANSVLGGTISGPLGQVQVNDARSAAAGSGWVATVISTAFTPPAGPTIGAANVGYTAGPITKVGTATFNANDPPNLTGVVAAVTATGITGDNSATWNPTINVTVPGSMAAGVYSGTITHSVS
jgi:hypothetical protein